MEFSAAKSKLQGKEEEIRAVYAKRMQLPYSPVKKKRQREVWNDTVSAAVKKPRTDTAVLPEPEKPQRFEGNQRPENAQRAEIDLTTQRNLTSVGIGAPVSPEKPEKAITTERTHISVGIAAPEKEDTSETWKLQMIELLQTPGVDKDQFFSAFFK
jgi:hypothetical protein